MKILITLSSFLTDIYCKGKNCRESHEKKFMGFEQHVEFWTTMSRKLENQNFARI